MSTGWSLISNSPHIVYNDHGVVELYLGVTASPAATTGGRYTIATFKKCAPSYGFITVGAMASTRNGNLTNQVAVMFGSDIKVDNFTGSSLVDLVVYAVYYSVYLPA